jgi:Fe-S-cluster containining protein
MTIDFSSWLIGMVDAIRGRNASDVPCDGCTACCTSAQFIHIGPGEIDTLAHIPKKLLFPAPLLPQGHMLLGYDKRGRCPMLIKHGCSIYEHRPRTCRTYDCRIFPAAGLSADGDKPLIARQAKRWRFSLASGNARIQRDAIRAAATFLCKLNNKHTSKTPPMNATQLAVLAVQVHQLFLFKDKKTGATSLIKPDIDDVLAVLKRVGRLKPLG